MNSTQRDLIEMRALELMPLLDNYNSLTELFTHSMTRNCVVRGLTTSCEHGKVSVIIRTRDELLTMSAPATVPAWKIFAEIQQRFGDEL